MKSYNDMQYRQYVLNQLDNKKISIETSIKKQQDELKILEVTIDNIKDSEYIRQYYILKQF